MSIQLKVGATVLPLNQDLSWSDEHKWAPVEQSSTRTVTGALIVQSRAKTGGRPITLEPADESSGWTVRAALQQLKTWAAIPGQVMELTLHGTTRNVIFRHEEGPIEADPVVFYNDPSDITYYRATVRLMEL